MTAFGSGERAAGMPGYDFLLQAMGGLMSVTGEADGPPLKVGAAVVDLVCGLLAVTGIQAALHERERTARGRHVEVSLLDAALTSLLNQGSGWVLGGARPHGAATATRASRRTRPSRPPTARSRVAVGNDRLFARLCEAIGLPELAARRALRDQQRARGATSTRSPRRSRPSSARSPPSTGSRCCGRPASPSARSTTSRRPTRSPSRSGSSRSLEVDGMPLARPPRLDGKRPRCAGARRGSTSTADESWRLAARARAGG